MMWYWWGQMLLVGLCLGGVAAWSQNAPRVFMKTLAIPLTLVIARLLAPPTVKGGPGYIFADFVLLSLAALVGDYLLGLKLGRNDREGFRHDSVGH